MGHIREPYGIDFVVDSTPVTKEEKKKISEIIAHYKATGRKMPVRQSNNNPRTKATRSTGKRIHS
jgi:hypothetical protein